MCYALSRLRSGDRQEIFGMDGKCRTIITGLHDLRHARRDSCSIGLMKRNSRLSQQFR